MFHHWCTLYIISYIISNSYILIHILIHYLERRKSRKTETSKLNLDGRKRRRSKTSKKTEKYRQSTTSRNKNLNEEKSRSIILMKYCRPKGRKANILKIFRNENNYINDNHTKSRIFRCRTIIILKSSPD